MKKVVVVIFIYVGIICAEDSPVIEIYSGWGWYPYSSYYSPYAYNLHNPWNYNAYHRSPLYPYSYPDDSGWYDNGYPYYAPYGGFYFQNRSVIIELNPRKILDLPNHDSPPDLPGSAPLSLRSEEDISLQSQRLNKFLSDNSETNKIWKR